AEELVARGARHLVLVGRSGPSAAASQRIERLREQGTRVSVRLLDIAERGEVRELFRGFADERIELKGVFHGAAVLDDGILLQQDEGRLRRVLAPKVAGACHLDAESRAFELDFFVLFSSTAAWLGAQGQATYAAANAFMDDLAVRRRSQDLPALSVAFGPWAEIGLAAAQDNRGRRMEQLGMHSLDPALGISELLRQMTTSAANVALMHFDAVSWQRARGDLGSRAFLAELLPKLADSTQPPQFSEELRRAKTDEQRLALLEGHVRRVVAGVLRLPAAEFDRKQPFGALGLDSLMALEIRNRLERSLGVALQATVVWSYPTLAALVPHLAQKLEMGPRAPVLETGMTDPSRPQKVDVDLQTLSDQEMALLLARELSGIEERKRG
ncbi:MAG TPA: beta-ketoacyl reductase, partial [Polyangiaceae bacterium]|nr:beta-ketoacyl reductase [Polyangiaceae bacterium]